MKTSSRKNADGRRVAVVSGLRTPFVKSAGVFRRLSALDLARFAVSELLARSDVDPTAVDLLVYGQVVVSPQTPNIAREVVLGAKAGEYYEVLSGLAEGEEVVTSGNFLIDSETKLKTPSAKAE